MKRETMTFDFDKAEEVIDRLRFINDEEEWHDQIAGITRAAVSAGLSGARAMRKQGGMSGAWYPMADDDADDPDGFLVIIGS